MGCGKQGRDEASSRRRLCKPRGGAAAGHTPSGAKARRRRASLVALWRHLPRQSWGTKLHWPGRPMKAFSWTEAPHGAVVADGKRLEAAAFGPPPGDGADPRPPARGTGLRRAVARLSGKTGAGDRLRRVRLFPRRLRPLRSGRSAASARLHDPRGPLQPACRSRRHRLPRRASWSATATAPRSRRSTPASMRTSA